MIALSTVLLAIVLCLASGQDLRRWSNDEVELIRTATPQDGSSLIIAAKHKPNYRRASCKIRSPNRETFTVKDGVVFNGQNEVANGIEAWDDGDSYTCGINILEKTSDFDENQFGGFMVNMDFEEGDILGVATMNKISASIHLVDDLLTDIILPNWGGVNEDIPIHYDLSLIPDLESEDPIIEFTGKMKITLEVRSDLHSNPSFHIGILNLRHISGSLRRMNESSNNGDEILEFSRIVFDIQKDFVVLEIKGWNEDAPYSEEPAFGDKIFLELDYDAYLDPEYLEQKGFGLYKEECESMPGKYCWFTQFESTGARYAFPCRDEPDKKATFDMKIARTDGWTTLANMPLVDTIPMDEKSGWVWDIFATSPPMSTYLVALAIQDFVSAEGERNVSVWARQDQIDGGLADYSVDIGPRVMDFYFQTFGIDYSLPKMDMVAVPKKGGAMENWGLILYSDATLLYDQNDLDVEKKWRVLEVVAHELAHQWFGNLVTLAWWDETWLNEGFASYMSHLAADDIDPDMNSWGRSITHRMFKVMRDDSADDSWAMSDSVTSKYDIGRKFGGITYSKGMAVIRMMEGFLTLPTLTKGLSSYLNSFQFSNAVEEDLFFHLEAAALEDGSWPQGDLDSFEKTMKTWTNQAGYPLVTVVVKEEELLINQTWYMHEEQKQMWDIPINFEMVGQEEDHHDWEDTRPKVWLTNSGITVPLDRPLHINDCIIANRKVTGYYRINYDNANWMRIANVLATDHEMIHPFNRAQIICDILVLSRSGHVAEEIKQLVLAYLDNEMDFTPLNAYKECSSPITIKPEVFNY